MSEPSDQYREEVRAKADRMARAQRERQPVWSALAQAGTIGWQLALPIVAGAAIGHTIQMHTGDLRYAIGGLLLGLAVGGWGAYRAIQGFLASIPEPPGDEEGP